MQMAAACAASPDLHNPESEEDFVQEVSEGLIVRKSGTKAQKRKASSPIRPPKPHKAADMDQKLDQILANMVTKKDMGLVEDRIVALEAGLSGVTSNQSDMSKRLEKLEKSKGNNYSKNHAPSSNRDKAAEREATSNYIYVRQSLIIGPTSPDPKGVFDFLIDKMLMLSLIHI